MPTKTFYNLDHEKQQRIFIAAVDEFANTSYEHAKLSHIIKQANIPRGSFYQYFEDKFDLYKYIFDHIGQEKLSYISKTLKNPNKIPFLKLFKELYKVGISFTLDNPKYVQITSHLLNNKGEVFNKIMKNNFELALTMYESMIEQDKSLGLIRKDIDTKFLAKLVFDLTINISIDSVSTIDGTFDIERINRQIDQIISIFEKGIIKGE